MHIGEGEKGLAEELGNLLSIGAHQIVKTNINALVYQERGLSSSDQD